MAVNGAQKESAATIAIGSTYDVNSLAAGARIAVISDGYDSLYLTVP